MKKLFLFIFFLLLSVSLCSCRLSNISQENDKISDLESRVSALESENESYKSIFDKILSPSDSRADSDIPSSTTNTTTQQSENDEPLKGFTYTVSNGYATITGYSGAEKTLVIPASIDGYKIIAIGDGAFEDSRLESVIISDGVESIGWFAFNGCVKLKTVTLPASVTSIGYLAFGNAESSTNIFCHDGSFALEYAKSFGLAYTVI